MRQATLCCLRAGAVISALVGAGFFLLSGYAAKTWIGDIRAAQALRLLALFLPVNCCCAILSGFFTACDRVRELTRVEAVERLAGLALTFVLLWFWAGHDAQKACSAIILGSSIACVGSTIFQFSMFEKACRGYGAGKLDRTMPGRPRHAQRLHRSRRPL